MVLLAFKEKSPRLGASTWVAPGAQVIGDVMIGHSSSVWYNCVLRGDVEPISIGSYCNIQDAAVMHGTSGRQGVTLGDRVSVGHSAIVHACSVGNDVLIGMGAKVLDEAIIEDDVFVAAGSLVVPRSRLESGFLYAGSPAVKKRELSDLDRGIISMTATHYAELAQEHRKHAIVIEGQE